MTDFSDDKSRQRAAGDEDPVPTADFSGAGEHTRELEAPKDFEQHIGRLPSGPESWSADSGESFNDADDATQMMSASGAPAPTATYPRADPNFFNERASPRGQNQADDDQDSQDAPDSKVESRFDLARQRVFDRIDDIGRKRLAVGMVLVAVMFVSLCSWIFGGHAPESAAPQAAVTAAQATPAPSPTPAAAPIRQVSHPHRTVGPTPHSHKKHRHR